MEPDEDAPMSAADLEQLGRNMRYRVIPLIVVMTGAICLARGLAGHDLTLMLIAFPIISVAGCAVAVFSLRRIVREDQDPSNSPTQNHSQSNHLAE